MKCAIVGSTKIAQIHAEQLLKKGVKNITFISRSKKKRKKIISILTKKISKKVFFYDSNLEILKKEFFDIICICSKTNIHDDHLKLVSKLKSIVIIEKPIISLLKLKNKYQNFLKTIYKKNKRIIVCYPYLYFSKIIKKFFNQKEKIKKINFDFQSGGNKKFKEICIDLMPHALSFFHCFLIKNFLKTKYYNCRTLIEKNIYKNEFKINNIFIRIILRENLRKKTSLKITVNNFSITRKTKIVNGEFINYIRNCKTNKIRRIKNPMSELYNDLFLNLDNKKYYNINRKITLDLMKKNYFLLNSIS